MKEMVMAHPVLDAKHFHDEEAKPPFKNLASILNVCDPFARVANIIDGAHDSLGASAPLRELLPGIWPTISDLRKLRDEMVRLGWTNSYRRTDQ